jgi:hypothetical protein
MIENSFTIVEMRDPQADLSVWFLMLSAQVISEILPMNENSQLLTVACVWMAILLLDLLDRLCRRVFRGGGVG